MLVEDTHLHILLAAEVDILLTHKLQAHILPVHKEGIHLRIKIMIRVHILPALKEDIPLRIRTTSQVHILPVHKEDIHIFTKLIQQELTLLMHSKRIRSNRTIKTRIRSNRTMQQLETLVQLLKQKRYT